MQIRKVGAGRAQQVKQKLSADASRRLKWMRYYDEHGCNARLTCRRFGMSPQTFYRWRRRFEDRGPVALEACSRSPWRRRQPTWSAAAEEAVLGVRRDHPRLGKDRLVLLLQREGHSLSTSMVGRILSRLRQRGMLVDPDHGDSVDDAWNGDGHARPSARRELDSPELRGLNLRERKKNKLRLQIYETAVNLFRRKGYDQTRIADITRGLDIGRATFFRYFPNKDALLHEYMRRYYVRVQEVTRTQLLTNASTAERLIRLCETLASEMEADRHLWHTIVFAGMTNPWRSTEAYELDRPSRELLEAIIAKGQKRGDVGHSFPVALLSQFMEGLLIAIISEWAGAPDSSYPLAERLRSAVAFFLARAKLRR